MYQTVPYSDLPPPPLSRTSSSNSFSSEEDASMSSSTVSTVINNSRRTRKRFTNVQLTMLENLFHQNSHPSREDREAVAKAGGMEIKSVTIWFQNKRQTERKSAASNNDQNGFGSNAIPNITSTMHTFSLHNNAQSISRTASPPFSTSSRSSTSTSSTASSRPSLDSVASRTELRTSAPRTPTRRQHSSGAIWDSMPSSPLVPPISPPAREFIDFGKNAKTRKTLEWACAAARVADKDGYASGMTSGFGASSGEHPQTGAHGSSDSSRGRSVHVESSNTRGRLGGSGYARNTREQYSMSKSADMDVTEDEEEEAITPPSTWGKDDRRWMNSSEGSRASLMAMTEATVTGVLPDSVDDDDMFKAALTLCGLGRRTS